MALMLARQQLDVSWDQWNVWGGQESRDKDTLVNTQHVLASDNGASAAPRI